VPKFSDITDLLEHFLGTAEGAEMLDVLDAVASKSNVILNGRQRRELAHQLHGFLSQSVRRSQIETQVTNQLTDRELEILRMIGRGSSNEEISEALGIRPRTVRQHVENMQMKLVCRGAAGWLHWPLGSMFYAAHRLKRRYQFM
jgi:DNA-binding NarL/FixJ family response regulator